MYACICGYNIKKVHDVFVELFLSKGLSDASTDVKSNFRVDSDIDIKLNQS